MRKLHQSLWPLGLLRSYQLGYQMRRPNNNAAPLHAIESARALVVLSSDRWTKVLVRRQAHAFEIAVGMAQGAIRATRFQRRSYKRCDREAWQSIRLASLGTERL
jgi:hypothetical protein